MEARTLEEITAELTAIAPSWVTGTALGRLLVRALARVMRFVEVALVALRAQLFRQTAAGEYLQDHAREVGVTPYPFETDDNLRARLVLGPRRVTRDAIRAELDALVLHWHGEGFEVGMCEPATSCFEGECFADDPETMYAAGGGLAGEVADLVIYTIPQFPSRWGMEGSFADVDAFEGECFAADAAPIPHADQRGVYEILEYLDGAHAAGVAHQVVLADIPQLAYLNPLLLDQMVST